MRRISIKPVRGSKETGEVKIIGLGSEPIVLRKSQVEELAGKLILYFKREEKRIAALPDAPF